MKFEASKNVSAYFRGFQKSVTLTTEEEKQLAILIQSGDTAAFAEMVSRNLKLVVKIANRHIGQGVPIDDLIQEGNIGLMEAAGRYMPDTNARFASYASLWIRKRINEAVAQTGRIVRLPHNMEIELFHAKREKPSEETVETLQAPKAVRIDNPVSEEGGMLLGELILNTPSQTQIDMEFDDLKFKVTKLVDKLKPRDKEIILDYFGIDREYEMPTDQIAEKHNMTNVRVCQIVKSSLQTLKQLV